MRRLPALCVGAALLAAGGAVLGGQGYLHAKAMLAKRLIASSFDRHLQDSRPHRPWSWADTWPIARLEVERLGLTRHVLAGASGSSLAFGLGHVDGTAPPNGSGNSVVAGHRDTWSSFLRELRPGDIIRLRTPESRRAFRVERLAITTANDASILAQTLDDRLTLVTCYPFDGLLRSPWRYVVISVPATGEPPGSRLALPALHTGTGAPRSLP